MAKRKQREATRKPPEPLAQREAAPAAAAPPAAAEEQQEPEQEPAQEPAAKRVRSTQRRATEPAPEARSSQRGRQGGRSSAAAAAAEAAAAAAAAAAAGRAESDVEGSSEKEEEEEDVASPEPGIGSVGGSQGGEDRGGKAHHYHGVSGVKVRGKATAAGLHRYAPAFTAPRQHGSWQRAQLGHVFEDAEKAARVQDQLLIAIHGHRGAVATGLLNFGLEEYPGERRRFGPDLLAYVAQLTRPPSPPPKERKRADKAGGTPQVLSARHVEAALRQLERAAEGLAAERRREEPGAFNANAACGVCPACRQPWRTDLGGCLRVASAQAAGHDERQLLKLLAANASIRAAAKSRLHESAGQQQQQQQQQQEEAEGDEEGTARSAGKEESDGRRRRRRRQGSKPQRPWEQLEWLEVPLSGHRNDVSHRRERMRRLASSSLQQRLDGEEAQLAATLRQEQRPGPLVPAAARRSSPGSNDGSDEDGSVEPGSSPSPPAVLRVLLPPGGGFALAENPRDTFLTAEAASVAQLAALCRLGGLEAPVDPRHAEQGLEAEGQQQEQQQRLAQRVLAQQQQQEHGQQQGEGGAVAAVVPGLAAQGGEPAAAGAKREVSPAPAAAPDVAPCTLCGGPLHREGGWKACPVMQMALAVRPPPQECPGCAHAEQPGCEQCLPGCGRKKGKKAQPAVLELARPWRRRAPWLGSLPPATLGVMEAAQALSSAAAADLDVPDAAWHATPKALLAVGLMAEEAAKVELAARFPAGPAAAVAGQAGQAAAERHA